MQRTGQIYLGFLMIVFVQCRRHHEFSYGGHKYGPDKWSVTWRECGGKRQSPINLDTSKCTKRNFKLKFNNHGEICKGYLINNGHAPTFVVRKCNKRKYITGIPFYPKVGYQLAQWHFHFGTKRDWGTEHSINGKRYTAELHMVHFNTKYRTVTEAIDKKDGIAVVAILFEEDPKAQLSSIERFFRKYGFHVHLPGHAVKSLFNPITCIPSSSDMLFYKGSLTTPGCYESVNWLIFKERQAISPRTVMLDLQNGKFLYIYN